MLKKILLQIFCILILQNTSSQFHDYVVTSNEKTSGAIINSHSYIPDSNTPIKYIRINFHFILLEDTHPDAPSNFTKEDDGRGNTSFTGYDWIDELIEITNSRLASNTQMTYLLNNNTPVIPRKYRFTLSGVFFHESNYYHNFSHSPISLSQNADESINVFFQYDEYDLGSHGYANMSGDRYAVFANKWYKYNEYYDSTGQYIGNWGNAAGLMHETGHNLSLLHTVMTNGGNCCDYCDDYCGDTPTRIEVINIDGIDPCQISQWNNPLNSNNIMDYSGYTAITPEQLGRVHWTIDNEMSDYQTCNYKTTSLEILSFESNKSYIAESVSIPINTDITIDDCNALYVNCEEFTINGTLKIDQGSLLVVQTH